MRLIPKHIPNLLDSTCIQIYFISLYLFKQKKKEKSEKHQRVKKIREDRQLLFHFIVYLLFVNFHIGMVDIKRDELVNKLFNCDISI